MWKVGGTKIERTRARYIVLPSGHVNLRKSDFLGKTLRTQKFSTEIFFGTGTPPSPRGGALIPGLGDVTEPVFRSYSSSK